MDNKNIDTSIKFGNGKRDGEVKQWPNKDLVELVELPMDIVTDYIQLRFMQILCKTIQLHKY